MTAKYKYSLLETLTAEQVDALILEEKLIELGYQFYYTADEYDISIYCYPLGMSEIDNEHTLEYFSDQFVAYQDFFNNNAYLLLLDQYKDQFITFRNKIIEMLYKRMAFVKDYEQFSNYLEDGNKNIKNDFGLLISTASGLLQDGATRFNFLVTKKRLIITFADFDGLVDDNPALKNLEIAFQESKEPRNEVVDKLENAFNQVKRSKKQGYKADCMAIDRICQINAKLINDNQKNLLLFLSSTKSSRETYFKGDIIDYPKINDYKFNFHRTSAQIFLQILLRGEKDMINQLDEIKNIVEKRNNKNVVGSEALEKKFEERIRDLRNRYAHESLLKQFDKFKNLFEQFEQSGNKLSKLKPLYNELKKDFDTRGIDEIADSAKELLNSIDYEYEFRQHYVNWLESIKGKTEKLLFTAQRGKDPIFGIGHHLPLLFVIQGYQKDMISVITTQYIQEEVEFLEKDIKNANEKIKDFVKDNVQKYWEQKNNLGTETADILVQCLLYLIIPFERVSKELTPEKTVMGRLIKFLPYTEAFTLLRSDFYYLLLWVARRNKDYDSALKYGIEAKIEFPNDARFPHGLCLVYYCKFREIIKNNKLETIEQCTQKGQAEKLLYNAISEGKRALDLYNYWQLTPTNDIVFKKSKASLMAALVVCYSQLYRFVKENKYLIDGRELVNEIKNFEKDHYFKQPEYRYVESLLEFQEYKQLLIEKEESKAHDKIKNSYKAIQIAYDKIPSREQYKEWHEIVQNEIKSSYGN